MGQGTPGRSLVPGPSPALGGEAWLGGGACSKWVILSCSLNQLTCPTSPV